MPKYKNIIEVKRKDEPYIYDICKDLKQYGKSVVDTSSCNWESVSRKWGLKTKPLVEHTSRSRPDPLIYPIARTKNNRKNSLALIQTPVYVKVVEEPKKNKSVFKFLKNSKLF